MKQFIGKVHLGGTKRTDLIAPNREEGYLPRVQGIRETLIGGIQDNLRKKTFFAERVTQVMKSVDMRSYN